MIRGTFPAVMFSPMLPVTSVRGTALTRNDGGNDTVRLAERDVEVAGAEQRRVTRDCRGETGVVATAASGDLGVHLRLADWSPHGHRVELRHIEQAMSAWQRATWAGTLT